MHRSRVNGSPDGSTRVGAGKAGDFEGRKPCRFTIGAYGSVGCRTAQPTRFKKRRRDNIDEEGRMAQSTFLSSELVKPRVGEHVSEDSTLGKEGMRYMK
jgi:hypothetical protein